MVNLFIKMVVVIASAAFGLSYLSSQVTASADLKRPQPEAADPVQRRALVIGNRVYQHAPPVLTAQRDARDLTAILIGLGFEVDQRDDLATRAKMDEAIQDFGKRLKKGDIGLFFYAGHAMQVDGSNYLAPVQATFPTVDDVKKDAVDLDSVFAVLRAAETGLNIIILDSCRDNGFPRRPPMKGGVNESCALGLAPPSRKAPRESIIAFATDPDTKDSSDPINGHSQYTNGLLKYIGQPGLRIEDFFKLVNSYVSQTSGNQQRPWMTSSLSDQNKETYFSAPAYILGRFQNGDDEVTVVVNGEERMVWTVSGANEIPIPLKPGSNTIAIQVYNAKTFREWWRATPEGWSYSICFNSKERLPLACLADGEDRPESGGPHHGMSFLVAKITIHVGENSGVLTVTEVNKSVWR